MLRQSWLALAAIVVTSTAHAAIINSSYTCGASHAPGRTFPAPDAPTFGLSCVSLSAISGSGTTCSLIVKNVFPAGQSEVPLETMSETRSMVSMRSDDIVVHLNKFARTAEIKYGNALEAECRIAE
jgi:hypothetical protein